MTQIRTFNFEDDDATFELNRQHVGILPPGRYGGFTQKTPLTNSLNLVLEHSTGHPYVNEDLTSANVGIILTKQGTVIRETADITMTVEPNPTNYTRRDLIVCEHEYKPITGGSAAIYKVIKGSAAMIPTAPSLPKPNSQTVIGILSVSPQFSSFSTSVSTYTPFPIPRLGNREISKLTELIDVSISNPANDTVVYWDTATSKFKAKSFKEWIETVRGYDEAKLYDSAADPSFFKTVSVGGTNYKVLDMNMAYRTLIVNYDGVSFYSYSGLPAGPKVGKTIRLVMRDADAVITEDAFIGNASYMPIKKLGGTTAGTFRIAANTVSTLVRRSDHWLWVGEDAQSDWDQSNVNSVEYIKNKPTILKKAFSFKIGDLDNPRITTPLSARNVYNRLEVFYSAFNNNITHIRAALLVTGTDITVENFSSRVMPIMTVGPDIVIVNGNYANTTGRPNFNCDITNLWINSVGSPDYSADFPEDSIMILIQLLPTDPVPFWQYDFCLFNFDLLIEV